MVSAEQFLAILEEKDLLPPEVLGAMRGMVRGADEPMDAQVLADWLIEHRNLTPTMAKWLLASAERPPGPGAEKPTGAAGTRRESPSRPPPEARAKEAGPKAGAKSAPPADAPLAPGPPPPPAGSGNAGVPPAPAGGFALMDELPPLDAEGKGPLDALMAAGGIDDAQGFGLQPPRRARWSVRRFFRDLRRFFRDPRRSIRNWLRRRSRVVRVEPVDPRKVKMLLFSWGFAVVLIAVVFALFWYLSPPTAGELFHKADVAYSGGKYAEAIKYLDAYLTTYPREPHVAEVRVRRGLAELHEAAEEARASGDWSPAFETAQTLMKQLPKEPAYLESQREVGEVLGTIGMGLARQAAENPTPLLVDEAGRTVGLIVMNIGESAQPVQALAEIHPLVEASQRQVYRAHALEETLAAVAEALGKKDALAALAARNAVVARYPELAEERRLEEALAPAAELLRKAVVLVPRKGPATTEERPTGVLASRALVVRTVQGEVPGSGQPRVFAAAEGAVYALDAATGRPLWRRFVAEKGISPVRRDEKGDKSNSPQRPAGPRIAEAAPIELVPFSGAEDVLATDPVHDEVLRIEGATGRLLWRQAVGQPIVAQPVPAGNRLLVPAENGQLILVDLATGASTGRVQLPQAFDVPPAVDPQRSLVFQVADQSTLYVLSQGDWACRQVFHLGHPLGGVAAPPVIAGNYLLVVVNEGPADATLRVLEIGPPGPAFHEVKAVEHVRLKGRVTSAPLVQGQRVAVVTVGGLLQVFELTAGGDKPPLKSLAQSELSGKEEATRYLFSRGDQWWVADSQLARYEIESGRLVPQQITDRLSRFTQPPVLLGSAICHVRQRPDTPGVTVSAVDFQQHKPIWQTWLAAPLAGEPLLDPATGALTAVTASGGVFRFQQAFQGAAPDDQPLLTVEAGKLFRPIHDVTPLDNRMFALTMGPGTSQIILYDPREQDKRFRWLLSPEPMAAAPVGFCGGILVPSAKGDVFLLDPQSTESIAKPFHPALADVTAWTGSAPEPIGEKEFILSDGDRRLYRVRLETEPKASPDAELEASPEARPKASLVEVASARTSKVMASPLAAVGSVAYVVDAGGAAVPLALPGLSEGKPLPLEGHCVWGPRRVGKVVLLATDKDRLYCFGDAQQVVWSAALPYGPLAGTPLAADGFFYLAARGGTVWRIAAESGKEAGRTDAGCPLGTGPVLSGERMFVGSRDGCLLEVKRP
jgi:outer membrane protein assembly factor BamB